MKHIVSHSSIEEQMKTVMKRAIVSILLVVLGTACYAQMAKFQALYVYNFAKNIGWAAEDNTRDLVITVVGDNDLIGELSNLAKTKKIGVRSVVVKEAATVNALPQSDIICLGEAKSGQIGTLVANQKDNKTLIVSGKKGQCANGASISFYTEGSKLAFEISEKNIKARGLSVLKKLLDLGTQVD